MLMMMMPLNNVRRRNQEVPLIFTRALLQWKHTIVAVQMTLAPTGTHSNALLTIGLLTSCYILTLNLHTVHIKNYVAFVEKENVLFLLLFKTG